MAGGRKRAKKRQGKRSGGKKKGSGVMMGMRSGFKNVANSVTGAEPVGKKKKANWIGTAITVALLLAAAALMYKRFG